MILRRVPGALALGLLASLGAHAALYGGDHAMGGGYHSLLVQVAIAGTLCLAVALSALAWNAAGVTPDGTVLAVRLNDRLPGLTSVAAAAALWFAVAEAVEPHHTGAPALAIPLALAAVAWIVRRIAIFGVACIARVAFAIARLEFSTRTPSWVRRSQAPTPLRRIFCGHRRFARPPPTVSLHCA